MLRVERFFPRDEATNIPVLPKITGKMKVVSYGSVWTRVIEQMGTARLNTVKSWNREESQECSERAGPHFTQPLANTSEEDNDITAFLEVRGWGLQNN